MNHPESQLQSSCLTWFRYQHQDIARLCFSVPNGGKRNIIEAKILKKEGATSGVSDLILLVSRGQYSSLCIEIKAGDKGKQSDKQRSWQFLTEKHGNKYVIVRSFDEFRSEIQNYLSLKS